jgi:hypothetical protein
LRERIFAMTNVEVYNKSEKFKHGWIAGFYDALSDDGLRYLDAILRYGPCEGDEEAFMAGYRAGRLSRLGCVRCYPESAGAQFKAVA